MSAVVSEVVIDLNNLDKSNWKTYRFDEIAKNVSERVDPNNTDLTVYIGLEHLDSGSIHIKRHGSPDDVNGQKLKFYKGDVIFGRRRAYQRKAAIATTDGFCSAHALVLRANSDVIVPELFPFFLHSDLFMERAIDISVGSLSPTINWGTLKHQEFLLPPKDIQLEYASLFTKADNLLLKKRVFSKAFSTLEKSKTKEVFLSNKNEGVKTKIGYVNSEWACVTLQHLLDKGVVTSHLDGNHGSYYPKSDEFVSEGIPYISANCIDDGEVDFTNSKYLTDERASLIKKGIAYDGDVLLAHNATVGPVAILKTKLAKVILSTTLTHFRVNPDKLDRQFLYYYMQSRLFQSQLEKVMNQSTRNQVPITTQRKLLFVLPPIEIQRRLVSDIDETVNVRRLVESNVEQIYVLKNKLINQVF